MLDSTELVIEEALETTEAVVEIELPGSSGVTMEGGGADAGVGEPGVVMTLEVEVDRTGTGVEVMTAGVSGVGTEVPGTEVPQSVT